MGLKLSGTPMVFRSIEDKIAVMAKLMGLSGALRRVERPAPLPIPGETSEIRLYLGPFSLPLLLSLPSSMFVVRGDGSVEINTNTNG